MGDFFDIANLITKVGVDAIKIKPEPGLPEKSSNEILTELFSTFDTEEGIVSPDNTDQQVPNAAVKSEKSDKAATKKKKSKKKHKHKEKKHKKKFKHNSSESQSDTESVDVKRRKKHKKKSKHKSAHNSTKSSESDEPKAKIRKLEDPIEDLKRKLSNKVEAESKETIAEEESKSSDSYRKKLSCFQVPPVFKSLQEEPEEPLIQKILEKPSVAGKIQIKDLKNSTVYNETVKEIEIKKKAKAARMEDGELSDSSMDNRTPTLSSPSPHSSLRSPSLSPLRSRKKHRGRSHDRSIPGTKNDLRLILKEKEKRRMEVTEKNRGHTDSDKDTKDNYYKHKKRSRSSKRSYEPRSPERTRSESQTRSNSHRSRSRGRDRHRDRSKDRRDRSRSYERRESRRSRERKRHRSNSEDRSRERYPRGRSRSKERKERIEIDKKKLLEIARKNAINMIKQGTLPLAQQDKAIAAIQAGGKTVDELTDFCKSLSKSEALGELSSISSDDDESGSDKGFHHPFLIKERPSSIILNIKDAKQLPTKTFQEKTAESCNQLRLQFPVSSGQHHRKTESEWIPVIPKKAEPKKPVPPPPPPVEPTVIPCPVPILPAPVQPAVFPQQPIIEQLDIGTIVSQRLAAMRKLRENPNDESALKDMYRAQNEMTTWAESKQMPGQFTGSTGAKLLSPAELTSGYQAWARKDQLVSAQPVSGGMGMALLQKMGWRPGEGLGKNKEGTLEPLQLEVKLDKRGLVSEQDVGQRIGKAAKPVVPAIKTLEGKHPVSLLGEYCSKRKIGAPVYELCFECGPDHRKNFLFKVRVNGIEYKPTVASPNKKQAKAEAAQICLQTLGLLPEPQPPPNLTTGT